MESSVSSNNRFFTETSRERTERVTQQSSFTDQKFNLLVIGSGTIGREHMRVATLLGRARVHGIYDKHENSMDIAEADFQTYSNEKLLRYADLQSACGDSAIDAILICTPNFTHFEVMQEALASQKPLFIEKPMATTLEDGARMVELGESYPQFLQIGMQYRYKAQYIDAFYEAKHAGSLGEIKTIAMSEYRPPFLDKVEQWNKFNEFSGGTLVEKCCHYFDLINLMADSKPISVYASGGRAVNFLDFEYKGRQSDIDDHSFVIINYANGIRASFTLNMFAHEYYEEMVVTGEQGRLVATESATTNREEQSSAKLKIEVPGHQRYVVSDLTYPAVIERSGHHGATYFEHEALVDKLEGKTVDAATPLQGLWAMLVASAAQQSIAENRVIELEEYAVQNGIGKLISR
ncbi:MAG: gfo/Idh/MocA family oxidoreductase [Pseudomonadales bacterium]|nr:gfo/Idh/MocA family oxidoreductase [Pseudomonadales bacterium]